MNLILEEEAITMEMCRGRRELRKSMLFLKIAECTKKCSDVIYIMATAINCLCLIF